MATRSISSAAMRRAASRTDRSISIATRKPVGLDGGTSYHRFDEGGRRRQHYKCHTALGLNHPIIAQFPHSSNKDDRRETSLPQLRSFHTTPTSERAAAIILGLASVSVFAYAGSSAIQSYNEWKAAQPTPEELEEMRKEEEKHEELKKPNEGEPEHQQKQQSAEEDRPRENIFRQWFDVGSKYYEGGFEDQMTRREAALILGVRESSSPERIKAAHRKLLVLNHPDTGGSTYMAGKINEAKELLLKGRAK